MDQHVESLGQLFPDLPEVKLRNALTSSNNDINLACSILLSEVSSQPKNQQSDHVRELMSMFPNLSKDSIKKALDTTNGNVDEAIQDLLCVNTLSLEERNSKQSENNHQKSNSLPKDSDWNKLNDNLEIVMKYGDVPRHIAQDLYMEQRLDPIRALIQLIFTYEEQVSKYHLSQLRKPVIKPTARVQSQNGFIHQMSRNEKPSPKPDVGTPSKPTKFFQERTYKYDPCNEQALALDDLIQSDNKLRAINHKFLERALEYFNGEVAPTVSLAILIAERKCAKYTGQYTLSLDGKNANGAQFKHQITPLRAKTVSPSVPAFPAAAIRVTKVNQRTVTTSSVRINESQFRNPEHYKAGLKMIENIMTSPKLDFHGWFPEDAHLVTSECLKRWWKQELSSRELNNQRLNQIQVMNVPNITIITGRGLHSVGGIPKVRKRIQKFLTENNYNYIEESSLFVVNGKKRNICI
ncbi:Cue2 [Kluyveromyces lactis]|nr:Cue2 [Kluyveromyces lactis]